MPRSLPTLLLVSFVGLGAAACRGPGAAHHLPPDQARALLLDRNWLDTLPESAQDRLHVFRFVPQMGGGVYQDRTLYAGSFELFRFEHTGEQIRFDLPHKDEHRTVAYRITALQPGEAQSPFDLRLDLERSPRGPSTYYGIRAETGHSPETLDQALRRLLAP